MNIAVPTAPPTSVSSSYQNFKRKLHSGKSETYDLAKVIDIVIKIHTSLIQDTRANKYILHIFISNLLLLFLYLNESISFESLFL